MRIARAVTSTSPHCSGNTTGRRGAMDLRLKRFHMRETLGVEDAFGYVLFGVVIVAAIVAIASLRGDRYGHVGRGGLFEDDPPRRSGGGGGGGGGGSASAAVLAAERDEEIRQMVEAGNRRRAARGQAPRDVDEEIARLSAPVVDPGLEAEVRELVEARNARRMRRGLEPLDVEAEVQRQIRDLTG